MEDTDTISESVKLIDPPPFQDVVQFVADGAYDGNLIKMVEAVRTRFQAGVVTTKWEVDWDGLQVSEDDLTLDEAWMIEKIADTTWDQINPTTSAWHCKAVLVVCLQSRLNLSAEEADTKVGSIPATKILNHIQTVEVVDPPFDSAS